MFMPKPEMKFIVRRNPDGTVHVQNVILFMGIHYGQHHVHTEEGFRKWLEKAGIKEEQLIYEDGECNCGLKPGYVREYDGKTWYNPDFE